MAELKSVTEAEYNFEISSGVVIADFWAPWCSNCRMLAGVVDQLVNIFDGKVRFIKVNVDECEGLAKEHNVQTLPTLILYKDGKEVDRSVGFKLKVALERWINNAL